ncbi:class I SAM-dependent methyltransferase [Brevibacillus migulae]|uniref:class I SAM-dependent methyltransferase n=1 Tax=Brevibacillus migulae TaxID=1644114 RepID=UPI00106ED400|nr:SAM-dependent methyltransferase [Brevibacillus migulae]
MELIDYLREKMMQHEQKAISFAEYMELALYHPQWGYYTAERVKVGKEGDFYTSASVHPVFAHTLADAILEMLQKSRVEEPTLVEVGGGTGYLMKHMLEHIRCTAPASYEKLKVLMVEASPYHRALQEQAIADEAVPKQWVSSIEEAAERIQIEGVVVSNEWLDAYPVHLLEKGKNGWREIGVTWDEQGQAFKETYLNELTEQAKSMLQEREPSVLPGSRVELNAGMKQAIAAVGNMLTRGYAITIDYGDEEEQLYHPSRKRGTLMCYYRHQAHDNPFIHVGEQDMTAHVNFSALQRWGEAAGLRSLAYLRQDQFLLRHGILQRLQNHQDRDPFSSEAMKRNRAIRQLIAPDGMGRVFRVLVQAKEVPMDLPLRLLQKEKWT